MYTGRLPSRYRPQRSCGQGYVFTRVYHSVNRGRVLSQHALQEVSQHALQQVLGGGGVPAPGGVCSRGVPTLGGVWPSVMAFWCDLLVWPSGLVAF